MPNQPTSFRLPFNIEGLDPKIQTAIRYAFSGTKDLNDAINALVPKVNTNTASITKINETISATVSTTAAATATQPLGTVNLQPNLTPGAYTLVQTDIGGLIFVQSAIPFALTLNSGLTTPFFTTVYNFGVGTITMTPSLGLVNAGSSLTVTTGELAIVYFGSDGNWYVAYPLMPQTFAMQISHWLNSYNALTGVFTATQPRAADLQDSTTGGGPVVLDSGATQINTTLTGITRIIPLGVFANNAAAIAGGLVAGDLYRNGANPDAVFVVH